MTPYKIEMQIKAILRQIQTGKAKNVYSAQNKIKRLKNDLKIANSVNSWNEYLSK